ncbi:unnamed protein product [[Candida] boidinii]|uniref:Unnamed protein product n=1 Tax=Candida boidinii TaxID=5477 RepID=A0A9W6T259_CANBO|nr:unnamed protein product [[Candida] boidinii]GMF06876.1 unnamed protein product [[Candida] boidinii]GMG17972.1 unnamed protein product [[Candida] boidinii]
MPSSTRGTWADGHTGSPRSREYLYRCVTTPCATCHWLWTLTNGAETGQINLRRVLECAGDEPHHPPTPPASTPASPSNKAQRLIRLPARSQQCEAQCQRICTVAHYVTGDEDEDEDEDEEERMSERKREGD